MNAVEALISPEVAEILARHELEQRQAELRKRVEQERLASRQRLQQRERDLDAQWRKRCEERGIRTMPRPSFKWSREDGAEILAMDYRTKRRIYGVASTVTVNSHNLSKDPLQCHVSFPVPLLWMHEKLGSIGVVTKVRKSARSVFITASLYDDHPAAARAWDLITQGRTYRSLSVGSSVDTGKAYGSVGGTRYYGSWTLNEVSIVDNPANKDCFFEILCDG